MDLVRDGLDTHVHTSPAVIPRKMDDIDAALKAKAANMSGMVLKIHEGCSCARAYLAEKATGFKVYGGLCLNSEVGGLNPIAVESSIKIGAKIVWLPTLSSQTHRQFFSGPEGAKLGFSLKGQGKGYTILDEKGGLKESVHEILRLAKEGDVTVATGHCNIEEVLKLVEAAFNEVGLEKIIFNHPDINFIKASLGLQKELASKGVFIEKCCIGLYPPWNNFTLENAAGIIKEIGPEQCILSSDLGQVENPDPPEGMRYFLEGLLDKGISEKDLRVMWVENPAALISQ